jgi:argininosuccinate synthase
MKDVVRDRVNRIVLAYSGGLDTSVAIPWLADRYHADIIAVTLDLGQGHSLEEVRDRALMTGAIRAHVLDVREEFARDYVLRSLKAGAVYEDRYPMATSLGRPLIAQKLVEIAEIEQATAIAHGSTAKGSDRVRIDVAVRALNPAIKVIAPARDWGMTRSEEIQYARERKISVPATVENPYSTDSNLWGR